MTRQIPCAKYATHGHHAEDSQCQWCDPEPVKSWDERTIEHIREQTRPNPFEGYVYRANWGWTRPDVLPWETAGERAKRLGT